jgi:hypothetical protein
VSNIDHQALMMDALDTASNVTTAPLVMRALARAQVHATALAAKQTAALVEQQRIASLLVVLGAGAGLLEEQDPSKATNALTRGHMAVRNAIRALVRDGLGLS